VRPHSGPAQQEPRYHMTKQEKEFDVSTTQYKQP
jgi:hypothetical protein